MVHQRLRRAAELLVSTDLTVAAIAERLHLASAAHLSALFRAHLGIGPRDWRASRVRD